MSSPFFNSAIVASKAALFPESGNLLYAFFINFSNSNGLMKM